MPAFPADHPQRYVMANELHARPFPVVQVPAQVAFVAFKPERDAARRDRALDRAHLLALLDRHGATYPAPDATHHACSIGRDRLKWESHTEFVTYTAIRPGHALGAFDPAIFSVFPEDWLTGAPGCRVTSILMQIDRMPDSDGALSDALADWFDGESLAHAEVLDGAAVVAADFRIDPAGHLRMAVFLHPDAGPRRLGRIVQRLCEIETYKTMSMLGLVRARGLSGRMGSLDARLSQIADAMTRPDSAAEATLSELLSISAELEQVLVQSSFRFGATRAYEALVQERIEALRERRHHASQTMAEFMARRYLPAMRTVRASEARLQALAERAMRAATLLGARVDVERSAQNQRLLESMDKRADLQLRLQKTVEGLSVVAISYYAVGLISGMVKPAAVAAGLADAMVTALVTPPVVLLVWLAVRRIRRKLTS